MLYHQCVISAVKCVIFRHHRYNQPSSRTRGQTDRMDEKQHGPSNGYYLLATQDLQCLVNGPVFTMYVRSFGVCIVQVWFLTTRVSLTCCCNMNVCCCVHLIEQAQQACVPGSHTPEGPTNVKIKSRQQPQYRSLVLKAVLRSSELKMVILCLILGLSVSGLNGILGLSVSGLNGILGLSVSGLNGEA